MIEGDNRNAFFVRRTKLVGLFFDGEGDCRKERKAGGAARLWAMGAVGGVSGRGSQPASRTSLTSAVRLSVEGCCSLAVNRISPRADENRSEAAKCSSG